MAETSERPEQVERQGVEPGDQQRHTGVVKWFNSGKGYGFIEPDEGGEDLFVHQRSIEATGYRSLREGERVEFDIEVGENGRTRAVRVTGPGGAQPQGQDAYRTSRPPQQQPPYLVQYPRPIVYQAQPIMAPRGPRGRNGGGAGAYQPGPSRPPSMPQRGGRAQYVQPRPMAYQQLPYYTYYPVPVPQRPPPIAQQQVVVHNLPFSCTWQKLKDVFRSYHPVRADIVQDSQGRSRGFGIVRLATTEDAQAAIAQMNGFELDGRPISVRFDRFAESTYMDPQQYYPAAVHYPAQLY